PPQLLPPLLPILFTRVLATLDSQRTVSDQNLAFRLSRLIGETPIALMLSALLAMVLLYVIPRRGRGENVRGVLENLVDDALGPVCSIILITGAGGAFGAVLTATGIGGERGERLDALGLPLIMAAYVVTMALRLGQGEATEA